MSGRPRMTRDNSFAMSTTIDWYCKQEGDQKSFGLEFSQVFHHIKNGPFSIFGHISSDWGRWKAADAPAVNAAVLFGGQVQCRSAPWPDKIDKIPWVSKVKHFWHQTPMVSVWRLENLVLSRSSCFPRRALPVPGCLDLSFAGGIWKVGELCYLWISEFEGKALE